jgi:dTDP-glucose 4,6-dehydratase
VHPKVVFHFAAETHVTRSEATPEVFFHNNVEGTRNVLAAAGRAGVGLVIHVSTDEVYGPALDRAFAETDKRTGEGAATSPYARSKALADDLAAHCEHVPVIVVRPTNCFGPWQHPEKAIPRWATRALRGEPIPVWGDGLYVRDWMYVEDACDAIALIAQRGGPGMVFNVAPEMEPRTNIDIARHIARAAGASEDLVYLTAYDRPSHDRRYAVDATRLRALGWSPTLPLEDRLDETVEWFRDHQDWWSPLLAGSEALYRDDHKRQLI